MTAHLETLREAKRVFELRQEIEKTFGQPICQPGGLEDEIAALIELRFGIEETSLVDNKEELLKSLEAELTS